MKIIVITLALLFAAVLLLGVKALFVKGGRFPSGHIHDLTGLRKQRKNKKKTL